MSSLMALWIEYKSYKESRLNNPDVAYYRWRREYPNAIRFEEFFDLTENKECTNVSNNTDQR